MQSNSIAFVRSVGISIVTQRIANVGQLAAVGTPLITIVDTRQLELSALVNPREVAQLSQADLVFVGEAPGQDEDKEGEPFVGAAGQLLTKIIQATGLDRDKVYIANILKCRPDTPGKVYGNRKPRSEEMETCFPWVKQQIEIIQPKVMVALGGTAVEGLLGNMPTGITRLRGNWQAYRGVPVMPTFHPSYLLRNQSWLIKRRVWETESYPSLDWPRFWLFNPLTMRRGMIL